MFEYVLSQQNKVRQKRPDETIERIAVTVPQFKCIPANSLHSRLSLFKHRKLSECYG